MIALCMIKPEPHYRRDAFVKGLTRIGYTIVQSGSPKGPEDLLCIWNRYGAQEAMARSWESLGGRVLVCENGYFGIDDQGRQLYAISIGGHNGSGQFPIGAEDRFASLGATVKPWRESGEYVLVCGQRGIGSPTMASPLDWHLKASVTLKSLTHIPIKVRPHPGNHVAKVPLQNDLAAAHVCAVWSSSSGVRALIEGVPVVYAAPHWICDDAAVNGLKNIERAVMDDDSRSDALQKMAHGQWRIAEIEAGEPFARIRAC